MSIRRDDTEPRCPKTCTPGGVSDAATAALQRSWGGVTAKTFAVTTVEDMDDEILVLRRFATKGGTPTAIWA